MLNRKYDFPEITFYFPPNVFIPSGWGPQPLSDADAAALVEVARNKIRLKGPRVQTFIYRRHQVTLQMIRHDWANFELFRCSRSKIFSANFDHSWCQHVACEPVTEDDTTRKQAVTFR
jgi:hypothetical protein